MSSGSISVIGKSAWVPNKLERTTFGAFCGVIRSFNIDARWLFFFMQTDHYRRYIQELAKGTNINNLRREHLVGLAVPVPPMNVQPQLVAAVERLFTEIDDGAAALERARGDLATWRKALLKAAITGELTADWRAANPPTETGADLLARILAERRNRWLADSRNKGKRYAEPEGTDTRNLPSLPQHWCWAAFEQLIDRLRNGISLKPANSPPGIPILRISSVRAMSVQASDRRWLPENFDVGQSVAQPGDLLFTRYNGNPDLVGVCGRYRNTDQIAYPDKIMCAQPAAFHDDLGDYLELAMNAGAARAFVKAYTKTSAGQHGVSGETVKRAPVPLPPAHEITEIVGQYRAASEQADEGWLESAPLENAASTLRQSILAAAFRGDLVA